MKSILLAALFSCILAAQPARLSRGPHRMEITVERRDASGWKAVDPALVFAAGDRLRFRFRTNFNGHLYVMNQGTSGDYTLLFPREDTGADNHIEGGREYLLPATKGAFRVTGPPGHDIIYWLVSPVELRGAPLPAPQPRKGLLLPRCDDTILRARGDCIDTSAGPKAVGKPAELPPNLKPLEGATSRELVFMQQQGKSVITSPAPLDGPVVYEFRLAHR